GPAAGAGCTRAKGLGHTRTRRGSAARARVRVLVQREDELDGELTFGDELGFGHLDRGLDRRASAVGAAEASRAIVRVADEVNIDSVELDRDVLARRAEEGLGELDLLVARPGC